MTMFLACQKPRVIIFCDMHYGSKRWYQETLEKDNFSIVLLKQIILLQGHFSALSRLPL